MQTEIWKPIEGSSRYEVSNQGNVRHVKHKKILKGGLPHNGYRQVNVYYDNNGGKITKCIHQLVAAAFLGPKPEGVEISHKDNDKSNNRAGNLEEYITHEENVQSNRKHPKKYCVVCGKQTRSQQKTCSRKCLSILHTVELKCTYCGDKFRRRKSQHRRAIKKYPNKGEIFFCSRSCFGYWVAENYNFGRGEVLGRALGG